MDKIKVKIIEHRESIIELDPENYAPGDRTPEGMMKIEHENYHNDPDYMDYVCDIHGGKSESSFSIEAVE